MRAARGWHNHQVVYERLDVGTGEWIQLHHVDRDGKHHVIELSIGADGQMFLFSDLTAIPWSEWKRVE